MITLAWDTDDVLNDLMRSWFEHWLAEHPGCRLSYESMTANPPHGLLGISKKEYLASLDAFRLSPLFQKMEPVPDVYEWFVRHGDRFRHVALTAVPLIAASASAQWVFKHFGRWIRTFHFVPSKRAGKTISEYDQDKAEVLQRFGNVDLFIDDNKEHVSAVQKAGIKAILFPRPWNQSSMSVAKVLEEIESV